MLSERRLRRALRRFLAQHLPDLDVLAKTAALAIYCQGLLLKTPQKSIMALARQLAPENIEGCRQRMQRALQLGRFDYRRVFRGLRKALWRKRTKLRAFCVDCRSRRRERPP